MDDAGENKEKTGGVSKVVKETERHVYFNNHEQNIRRCKEVRCSQDNHIITSKYNVISFLPRNLFEQFSRVANAYFLILLILQLIPQIASLSWVTTAVPLIFVLAVTALKDGVDDWKRHKSDRIVNGRKAHILRGGKFVDDSWSNVIVGDILQIRSDEFVPADVVIISTNTDHGECFVETAELDGETNLKVKRSMPATKGIKTDAQVAAMKASIKCEPPNNKLHRFEGTLDYNNEMLPLGIDAILLRGCTVRNTHWVNGIVVFAGPDTKLMQNSGATRFKRTHVDKLMNKFVFTIFAILFVICLICAILSSWWERAYGNDFTIYLQRVDSDDPSVIGTLNFFSYVIVLNTLVPISLYVSVEIIRLGQSWLIDWDVKMYHKDTDTPAQARTTTLNEELGQIDYVFSDKTGTLTQNVMNFLKCSVGGQIYGKDPVEGQPYAGFIDDRLRAALDSRQEDVHDFFRLLAVCHTVQPETIEGKVVYQAQSPDEKALADAARDAGFVFESRTSETINILVHGKPESYKLLNIIEFNSTRKRMTVLLQRPDGRIFVYSKGADNIMFARLSQRSKEAVAVMQDHLHLFAKDGLRTLVLAQRELTKEFYNEWKRRYNDAETSLDDREGKSAVVAEEVENDLELVGASAIEDQLQFNVPNTIANLKAAKIKVWVLTGDKQETAINIGSSCRLLTAEMEPLLIINGSSTKEVRDQLAKHVNALKAEASGSHRPYGLVIDGPSLVFPLPPEAKEKRLATEVGPDGQQRKKWTESRLKEQEELEDMFVEVSTQCAAVVCCRVSPLQKSQVVRLIKRRKKAVTLAIGDGANDVSMIKAAHVGVGISGLEGRQAVLASDYSIAQFRFLERLLLVHGRWSYLRMCSFLRYFFYKNFAFTLVHFWFAFFCAYSAQTVYDQIFIALYNVVFTSLPILVVGIFEQDVSADQSIKYPYLYEAGPLNSLFSYGQFLLSLVRGAFHSLVIYFVTYLAFRIGGQFEAGFQTVSDLYSFSTVLSVTLIFIVTIALALDVKHWNWIIAVALAIGPSMWLAMFGAVYNWNDYLFEYQSEYYGSFNHVFQSQTFWGIFFLCIVLCNLPLFASQFYFFRFRPTPTDYVRWLISLHKAPRESIGVPPRADKTHELSGYAFSQEDNVGRDLFPMAPMVEVERSV